LHPLTINTLVELLRARRSPSNNCNNNQQEERESCPPPPPSTTILTVALEAGRLAADALQRRQDTSQHDGMTLTVTEQQTIAGRIVGVAVRWSQLEAALTTQCRHATWIAKYNAHDSFGILPEEIMEEADNNNNNDNNNTIDAAVQQRIIQDPLFAMNRAECLLALFLHQVEAPELQRKNATVPDDSVIDFLDADRKQVLVTARVAEAHTD
jgi:hypothetical protein